MTTEARRRILLIDDNHAIHEDYRKILLPSASADAGLDVLEAELFGTAEPAGAECGFELDSALQGQEGHQMLRSALERGAPYALAFVDMRMPPGWDGLETIMHLWKTDPELEIVICTAYSDHSWEELREKLGRTDRLLILKKPFDNIEVRQFAHALTEKWRLRQELKEMLGALQDMLHDVLSAWPGREEPSMPSAEIPVPQRNLRQAESVREALSHSSDILSTLTSQMALKVKETEERADRDGLTLLFNRASLDRMLREAFDRALTTGERLSLLFCDIDHFKRINDTYGHQAGDRVLQQVAGALRKTLRPGDIAGRYGGEEFISLLPELDERVMGQVAERIRTAVSSLVCEVGNGLQIRVTISIGAVTHSPSTPFPSLGALVEAGDRCMYAAKRGGRDRVVLYQALSRETAVDDSDLLLSS